MSTSHPRMGSNHETVHDQNRQIDHNYHDDMDKIVVHYYMLIIDFFFINNL